MIRKDSLADYTQQITWVTVCQSLGNTLMKKMVKSIRHSSFITMHNSEERQKKELK